MAGLMCCSITPAFGEAGPSSTSAKTNGIERWASMSKGSIRGSPMSATYNASKGAVLLLTKCMALDFGRYGIRVNCTCPGVIDTQMADELLTYRSLGDDERKQALFETYRERHAVGRFGQAEEVAKVVLFLASDESSFV